MKPLSILVLTLMCCMFVSAQNEQAPIVEKDIDYKAWTLRSVRDGSELDLRDLTKGKKLVAVVYYAPWCPNWRHDAPMLERLYQKYKGNGFEIIGVAEYDTIEAAKANLNSLKLTFPMVYESGSRDDRLKTRHYLYRQSTGDTRKWGSPYYVFIEPALTERSGDTILKRTSVINGEMIESEGEHFIRQKLGFKPDRSTSN